jgi:hypothetical protein
MDEIEHSRLTQTTDEGPFNGLLERPALRSLVPRPLHGASVLDAGCGSGAQREWSLDETRPDRGEAVICLSGAAVESSLHLTVDIEEAPLLDAPWADAAPNCD